MRKEKQGKKIIFKLVLSCLVFAVVGSVFFYYAHITYSQSSLPIEVISQQELAAAKAREAAAKAEWSWKKAIEKLKEQLTQQSGAAFKAMLGTFLKNLAYDTATYLASGDWGQTPMHEPRNIGRVIRDAADNAGGSFLERLGQGGPFEFNLCQPNFGVTLSIGLGLERAVRPETPECTLSEMRENWEEELNDPNFLRNFQASFDPWQSDLGIALSLQTGIEAEMSGAVEEDVQRLQMTEGWRAVTDPISGAIRTPASLVAERAGLSLEDATTKEKTYTGTLADAIDVFANTLISKLFEKWFKEGIWTGSLYDLFGEGEQAGYLGTSLYSDEAQALRGGVRAAKEQFRELIEPDFSARGDYDILTELAVCPDPTKAGPTNCVITNNFKQAVENKMTVGEAVKEGYLNPEGVFGFTADGLEPSYYADQAYPYRSLIILRKFRIIPVGWELAAQYIKMCPQDGLANCIWGGTDGAKNLEDLVNCFASDDNYGTPSDTKSWCQGMVDPDWVLKAPLNYCQRQGPGPEIVSEQVVGEGYDSELTVNRNDNYCADEKTCIQEKNDGSCAYYGYCTEERRKWQFDSDSCEPKYNTCQTFSNREGKTASYLENTLDFSICDIDNVGCQKYALSSSSYDPSTDIVTWNDSSVMYFDRNTEECDSDPEGCHEFIRTKAGIGANLLPNSSFEIIAEADLVDDGLIDDFDQWGSIGQAVSDSYDGMNSVQLSGAINQTLIIDLVDYTVTGETFSLSFYAKDCQSGSSFWLGESVNSSDFETAGNWSWQQISYSYPTTGSNQVDFNISGSGSNCKIDAVKLERSRIATTYSDYGSNGLVYEKLLPDYLESTCYMSSSNYQYRDNAPYICYNYARKCNVSEVDCEFYTSVADGFSVPARVTALDYCPAECVGYDTYIQGPTIFDSSRDEIFIPATARTCGAGAVGCDEFTNLDEVEQGGEGIEYYSYLRRCHKSSDPSVSCGEFYIWEGSDQSGYQLYVYNLVEDASGEPAVTDPAYDSANCDDLIFKQDPTGDCRQFYNRAGEISYHLLSLVYICSEECIPFRRTEVNIDPNTGGVDCINNGEWDAQHQACIYHAIPEESRKCGANQAGCREYSGNRGNNIMILFTNDFEDGTNQGWSGGTPSSWSVIVGEHSLEVNDSASLEVGGLVKQGKSYVISFIAKSGGASSLEIKFVNDAGEESVFGTISNLNSNWDFYKVNLINLDHEVSIDEILVITGGNTFYIDNIRLTEIVDRYFLIKNSWLTPESCYNDIAGNYVGPYYNIGCDGYYDRKNDTYYLHDFTYLCQESAIGCELMIDTQNSSDYSLATSTTNPMVTVPEDGFIYAVYDSNKRCGQTDKGCQRLGASYQYATTTLYSDIYLKNDPDQYSTILCDQLAVGCEEWVASDGASAYFKDPEDQVCQWRQQQGVGAGGWNWWKKKVHRCDDDDNSIIDVSTDNNGVIDLGIETTICLNSNDCGTGISCILDENDYACSVNQFSLINKTFGYGGPCNSVSQPTQDADGYWAGLCPADQAGCTEYIDPISSFSVSLVFNNDFSQDVDSNGVADGWSASANGEQGIVLAADTLYILAVEGSNGAIINTTDLDLVFYELDTNSNQLNGPLSEITVNSSGHRVSKQFYLISQVSARVTVTNASPDNGSKIEVKRAVIDYQLKQDIDLTACNGIVNFKQGCVLFNERAINGAYGYADLYINADLTVDGDSPNITDSPFNASQQPIKVSPDRTCDKWLACRSYIKDEDDNNVCFDVGLCDSVDENGNCNSFVITNIVNQSYGIPPIDANYVSNLSGYAKVGHSGSSFNDDYYPLARMEQVGEVASINNGNFEITSDNDYPVGWAWEGGAWDEGVFKVIDNPIEAQDEGIDYPMEGRNFLKLGSTYSATSEYINVANGVDYILTAYINTNNLTSGEAKVRVEGSVGGTTLSLPRRNNWTFKLGEFTAASNKIRVILYADSSPEGNFYFDDIKIKPALYSKWDTAMFREWYTPQSCRLYPQDDALSCDYYDDSGMRQKGWLGYCLEYDHYPGSKDACLLWHPIDKVMGEGIEEGMGYSDKMPVYYCLEAAAACGGFGSEAETEEAEAEPELFCAQIVQTVTSVGENKYWAGRVYEGSDYEVFFAKSSDGVYIDWGINSWGQDNVVLNYYRDSQPFGSIVPLEPVSNPYEWDSEENTEENTAVQPLYVFHSESGVTDARAGTPYSIIGSASCLGQTTKSGYLCTGAGTGTWSANLGVWDNCVGNCIYPPEGGCIFGVTHDLDYNWVVNAQDSTANADCDYVVVYCYNEIDSNMNSDPSTAIDGVKRLFAQSYGAWEWYGMCENGVDNMTNGRSCADNSYCECYNCIEDCSGTGDGTCESRSGIHCDAPHECRDWSGGMAPWRCYSVVDQMFTLVDCTADADCLFLDKCVGGPSDSMNCADDSDCLFDDGWCVGGPNALQDCTNSTDCACYECDPSTCIDGTCSGGTCIGGVNNGQNGNSCTNDYECGCRLSTCQDGECDVRYRRDSSFIDWGPPDAGELCNGGAGPRPAYPNDYCAILPQVTNIKVENSSGNVIITRNGFANLEFNSIVDGQQLPLVMYAVDWGDNETIVVSGVEMRDRPNPDNPHSLYHLYSYWDLKAKTGINCLNDCSGYGVSNACCVVQPRIKIQDNWGWCNGGSAINDCNQWVTFGGWVVVTE